MTVGVTCGLAGGATLHTDDFNAFDPLAPTLKWEGGSAPTRIASGGVDDSPYLRISTSGFHLATRTSEARWTGDYAAVGASRVNVDLMTPASSLPLEIRLVLFGPANENNRWTSTVPHTVPNDGVWRSYTFSIAEADLTAVLTSATYNSLLSDVRQVMLRYDELADGPDYQGAFVPGVGILGIDNIQLAETPLSSPPGDFDGDGDVDGDDLTQPPLGWTNRFGADLEGADFLVWQRNFGTPAFTTESSSSVPEPTAFALAAGATVLGILRRRWRVAAAA